MLNDQLYLPMKILYYSFEVELIHNNELKNNLSNDNSHIKYIYIIHLDLEQEYIFLMVMESEIFINDDDYQNK
jgi:hypothetical protein